jgi:hypothetical protein
MVLDYFGKLSYGAGKMKFATPLITVLLFGLAANSAIAQTIEDGSDKGLDPQKIKALIAKVPYDFFDPSSAKFRNLRKAATQYPDRTICGQVNAKNRLGAYVGFKPFFYDTVTNEANIYLPDDNPGLDELRRMAIKYAGCTSVLND